VGEKEVPRDLDARRRGPHRVAEAVHVVVEEGREREGTGRLGVLPRRDALGQRALDARADRVDHLPRHDLVVQRVHREVVREGRELKPELPARLRPRRRDHPTIERLARELHRHPPREVRPEERPEGHVPPVASDVPHAVARARREQRVAERVERLGRRRSPHDPARIPREAHAPHVRREVRRVNEMPHAPEHLDGLDGAVEAHHPAPANDRRGHVGVVVEGREGRRPPDHARERLGPQRQHRALVRHEEGSHHARAARQARPPQWYSARNDAPITARTITG